MFKSICHTKYDKSEVIEMVVRVAINGYGTIGRRAAEAISLQDDMVVVGVTKTKPNYEALALARRNLRMQGKEIDLYVIGDTKPFEEKGIPVKGRLEDLLQKADIVVDCSPELGKENKKVYANFPHLKQLYQGGEDADIAEVSFVAQCNYMEAWGKNIVRNVSCNTTGASRAINAFTKAFHVIEVMLHLARRTVDPKDSKKGPVNAYELEVSSHHADDIKTVIKNLNVYSNATKARVTEMHVHALTIDVEDIVSKEDVISLLSKTPRVMLVSKKDGFSSTAQIREYGRIANYHCGGDLYETIVWKDLITAERCTRTYHTKQEFTRITIGQGIHQEADVVPEIVDAIRAMFMLMPAEDSIRKTNATLGIQL